MTPSPSDAVLNSEAIDHFDAAMQGFLRDALRILSVSGHEAPFTRFVADFLQTQQFDVDLWEADESQLSAYPVARSKHIPLAGRPTLVARHKGVGGGRSLLFNAHADVVDVPDAALWTHGPWAGETHNGRYFGRGACDVKGALVSAIWAMLAIKHTHPAGLAGDLLLELVPGEEDCVTLGTLTSVVRGHTADACVVLEPTQCLPRNASRPGLRFEITCGGRAVHGTVKWLGQDAIKLAEAVLAALAAMESKFASEPGDPYFDPYPIARPITVDRIRGGDWQGMIASECVIAGYFELLPVDDPADWSGRFTSELRGRLAAVGCDPQRVSVGFVEQYDGHRLDSAADLCRSAEQVVRNLRQPANGHGLHWAGWTGFNSGCEAGLRAKLLGTPTLVWGPGSLAQAHAADEYVAFDEVKTVAAMLQGLAIDWCG